LELLKQKIFEITMASAQRPFEAFMAGFTPILNPQIVVHFTAAELKRMAEGTATVSIEALKEYTDIEGVELLTT
jgi:hypothetical protein